MFLFLFRDDEVCLNKTTGEVKIAFALDYDSSNSRKTYNLNFCRGTNDSFLLG